jgi:Flp pilus assembly protein TadD
VPKELRARALAARSELRLAQQDTAGAIADALDAETLDPGLGPVRRALALTAPSRGADPFAAWRAAIEADPHDPSSYFDGSAALVAAGDPVAAEKLLGSFAATQSKTSRFHLALARLHLRQGNAGDAEAELAKAQSLDPMDAQVYLEQGRAAQVRKDAAAAVAAYEKAAQLRDDLPEIYRQMGLLYLETGAVADGLRAYTEALGRYRAARAGPAMLEPLFDEVKAATARAGQQRLGQQWVKEARAAQ